MLELPPNLEEVNLWKIFHKSNLGALLGLPVNCKEVAGNSGQLAGNQLRKNFCEVAWERSLGELSPNRDEFQKGRADELADEWMLIDGRNRREACRLAGITPTYRILEADAEKLKSLVWSWNGPRRHLTSSQKAMAYAMMYPEPEKGGRGNKLSRNQDSLAPSNKTEKNNAVLARFILKHAPETAKLVRDGHPNYPLSKTYDAVKDEVAEHAENEIRKDFTVSERVEIGKAVEAELGKRQGQRTDLASEGQGGLLELPGNCPEFESGETREIAARKAGFGSDRTYLRAKAVAHHATPELAQAMDQGRVAISTAARPLVARVPNGKIQDYFS
mgnify:CR=1 FL=1